MNRNDNLIELLILFFICTILVAFTYATIETIYEPAPARLERYREVYDQRPDIPKCDRPLWDRVRHMCPSVGSASREEGETPKEGVNDTDTD